MSNGDYQAGLDGFIADLKGAWRAVGAPPLTQLESISERVLRQHPGEGVRFVVLAPSTTSEILAGRRKQAPKWPWVLTFLSALRAAAPRGGIDAAVVGDLDEWKRRHEAVLAARDAPPLPARPRGQRRRAARGRTGVIDPAPAPGAAAGDDPGEADVVLGAFLTLVRQAGALPGRHGCGDIAPEWLESYLTLESSAEVIRIYETRFVPGLMRTREYAREVIGRQLPGVSRGDVSRLAELCLLRQTQGRHQEPRRLWAVVEEAALRDQRIDAPVMRVQVERLIELSDDPRIALQVVPAGRLTFSEPVTIFRFPEPFLGDVVCLEQPDDMLFLHERKDTDHYSQFFDNMTVRAAPPDITRRMLVKIRDEL